MWHLVTGKPYLARLGFGLRAPRAPVPGMDVAGQVEAVGVRVTEFRPGDEVFGVCAGSFAEYARARAVRLAHRPENLTAEQAAAMPVSGCTALRAIRVAKVRPGQTVLVIGASGGVGSFAVQVAKAFGAEVTGVCRTAKVDFVRSIGADHVLDYTREDIADGTRRYDVVLDIGGHRSLRHLRRALTPRGARVIVGGEDGGPWLGGSAGRSFRATAVSPFVRQRLRGIVAIVKGADLATLRQLVEAGTVTPAVDRTYPLADAGAAVRDLRDGHIRGKAVLTV